MSMISAGAGLSINSIMTKNQLHLSCRILLHSKTSMKMTSRSSGQFMYLIAKVANAEERVAYSQNYLLNLAELLEEKCTAGAG